MVNETNLIFLNGLLYIQLYPIQLLVYFPFTLPTNTQCRIWEGRKWISLLQTP